MGDVRECILTGEPKRICFWLDGDVSDSMERRDVRSDLERAEMSGTSPPRRNWGGGVWYSE
jgi:hypothetical protein